jgi:hypothetical protein
MSLINIALIGFKLLGDSLIFRSPLCDSSKTERQAGTLFLLRSQDSSRVVFSYPATVDIITRLPRET